jgi:hypothetical protein
MPAEFLNNLPKNLTTHLPHKLYSAFPNKNETRFKATNHIRPARHLLADFPEIPCHTSSMPAEFLDDLRKNLTTHLASCAQGWQLLPMAESARDTAKRVRKWSYAL